MVTHQDFSIAQLQISAFTPGLQLQAPRVLSQLLDGWSDLFDGDPIMFPAPPPDFPQFQALPRVILQSSDHRHRLQFGPARIDLLWIRQDRAEAFDRDNEIKQAVEILLRYLEIVRGRTGRLACLATRTAPDDNPPATLARHFCKKDWLEGPLNRPGAFEVHAHKRFFMLPEFEINSWIRCKSGSLTSRVPEDAVVGAATSPVIVVEQDFNTLQELQNESEFEISDILTFFATAPGELDKVIESYFPS